MAPPSFPTRQVEQDDIINSTATTTQPWAERPGGWRSTSTPGSGVYTNVGNIYSLSVCRHGENSCTVSPSLPAGGAGQRRTSLPACTTSHDDDPLVSACVCVYFPLCDFTQFPFLSIVSTHIHRLLHKLHNGLRCLRLQTSLPQCSHFSSCSAEWKTHNLTWFWCLCPTQSCTVTAPAGHM